LGVIEVGKRHRQQLEDFDAFQFDVDMAPR
jgi:hypothetical protein